VTAVIASAPGKIVLCGEYAVLEGAPAICMAVDRRAHVEIYETDNDVQCVVTSGYFEGKWTYRVRNNRDIDWLDGEPPGGGLGLLREAWRTTNSKDAFDIRLDTREFVDPDSRSKLGLGSSAALTAALVTALLKATNGSRDAAAEAAKAHSRLQHGQGSGVDIAASLDGSIIEYRMNDSASWRYVPWPEGLEYAVYWSGRPVSTTEKLEKFHEARRRTGSAESMARLYACAESVAKAWSAGNNADLLAELGSYVDALMRFGVDHELGIFDAGHEYLAEATRDRDVVYKPCGAGGGDIGIALATDRQAIEEFTGVAEKSGYRLLDVALDTRGVLLEG